MTPDQVAAAESGSLREWIRAERSEVVCENVADAIATASNEEADQIKLALLEHYRQQLKEAGQ